MLLKIARPRYSSEAETLSHKSSVYRIAAKNKVGDTVTALEPLCISSFGNVGKLVKFRVRNEQC